MHIPTIEENYDYRMKNIMENFLNRHEELKGLDADKLQDEMWKPEYAVEFAHAVMEDMQEWSGDELFEAE